MKELSDIQVMVISEVQQQRLAFCDTVSSLGFTLIDCILPSEVSEKHLNAKADVWLVDSQYDEHLHQQLADNGALDKTILVGFDKAPYLNEAQLYGKWQRKLRRKLATMLGIPELSSHRVYYEKPNPWRYVVYLGASLGGTAAVRDFLDHLSPDLPITIILAHHFNHNMIHTLPRVLNRHNNWRCQVVSTSQTMQAGQCLIVPILQKVVCDSTGRVIFTQDKWEGRFKPDIGGILKNISDVFGEELIGIIFSGMSDDCTQYLPHVHANNSQLWAQDPASSVCNSQPQAVIDSGYTQFVGTPEQLASRVTEYVVNSH